MRRFIFIVEGETEEAFVNTILAPYFQSCGIQNLVQCFKIKHTRGGMHKYSHVRNDVSNTIFEYDAVVTTMFDFYALPSSFPGCTESQGISNHRDRVKFIESKMKEDMEMLHKQEFPNYVPYIQLHEFEALTFSSSSSFKSLFEETEMDYNGICQLIADFPNPEDINDSTATSPSKRIEKLIPGYNKVLYGNMLIECCGMEEVLSKCPHFREWIEKLKSLAT